MSLYSDKSLVIRAQFEGDMSLSIFASLNAKREIQDTDNAIRIVSAKEKTQGHVPEYTITAQAENSGH